MPPLPSEDDAPKIPFMNVMALPVFSLPPAVFSPSNDLLCQRTCMEERDQAARRASLSSSFSKHGQRVPNSLSVRRGYGDLSSMVVICFLL